MIYKYLYVSRVNGIKIRTDRKLNPLEYKLISEYRDAQFKKDRMILK